MILATPAEVEEAISLGQPDALLIPWASDLPWAANDPIAAINASVSDFIAAGWGWNPVRRELTKSGWVAFYRSQGALSRPILQWSRGRSA